MREKRIEQRLVRNAEARGGRAFKWVSPGVSGVPDRLVLLPIPPEHRAVINRYVRIIETKAPGKELRPLQRRIACILEAMGYNVNVVDSYERADEVMR